MSLSDERLEEIASSLGKSKVYGEITSALRELQSLRASQAKVVEALRRIEREDRRFDGFDGYDDGPFALVARAALASDGREGEQP